MDKITKKDVEYIASLARIELGEKEKGKIAEELGAVLNYVGKLKEVNTDGAEPITQTAGLENILRKDEANARPPKVQTAAAVKLVEMAPDSKNNFVKVPAILGGKS